MLEFYIIFVRKIFLLDFFFGGRGEPHCSSTPTPMAGSQAPHQLNPALAQARQALCLWNQRPRSTVNISDEKVFSARRHAERAICYRPSARPSVCLSVRLSVTRVDQSKTVERIIEILSPSDRPKILVFRRQRSLRKSDGFTPNGGAKHKGGSKN